MTPQSFIAQWGKPNGVPGPAYHLNEEQGAQSHFLDLCELLKVPKPGSAEGYLFEEKNALIGGRTGYADVFMRGAFAWENKAPGKNLDVALRQLQNYSMALSNPPLLVVSDRLVIRIHTQFTGHPTETHEVRMEELDQPDKLALLRRIWTAPESFKPKVTNRDITEKAARSFANLADGLRKRGIKTGESAQAIQSRANQVAHFLTQCVFCFFAEDVGLLPGRMFERLVNNRSITSDKLTLGLHELFRTMQKGGLFGTDDIPWFNGHLFKTISVPRLQILDVTELRNAAALNWSAIDVSIFGTLFERGLDPAKRSQLGAHYTDPATIMRIVEPVVQRPLQQIWENTASAMQASLKKSKRKGDASSKAALKTFVTWLDHLRDYRVLDPACGSGNFLFLGLKALKDIEHKSHLDAAAMGLDREADLVTGPHNVLGIELNEYAAELARVTVWIGELQWRLAHGYEFKTNPVLEPLQHIECRDALLSFDGTAPSATGTGGGASTTVRAEPVEAPWPKASVVIGNPPFLGDKKMRSELGDAYTSALRTTYQGRVPGGADLVCYWFEKARAAIESSGLGAAGLVATNSIRGGKNRTALNAIAKSTRIYEAWSDEEWVNDGAAVRVSLLAFGHGTQDAKLDGQSVGAINADLSANYANGSSLDLTTATSLAGNKGACFIGGMKKGSFDIEGKLARSWLSVPNPHGKGNFEVVKPWLNGLDITRRPLDMWIVDFGLAMPESDASLFDMPFAHVTRMVRPQRSVVRNELEKARWWLHARPAPDLRRAVAPIARSIATARVAKHRLYVWLRPGVVVDGQLVVVARADDTTFGILHSRFHELWSLRMGTSLEDRPRYTPTTCFEAFPFPNSLSPADTASQQTEVVPGGALIPTGLPNTQAVTAIAVAAKRLSDLRDAWLNPPEWTHYVPEVIPLGLAVSPYPDRIEPRPGISEVDLKALQKRTLTNLYNQRPAWLAIAHQQLDDAVAAAYGWLDYTPAMSDDEILKRLLALNLERSDDGNQR